MFDSRLPAESQNFFRIKRKTRRLSIACVDLSRAIPVYSKPVSGSSSVVECFLAKEDVAGSTPVSRSNNLLFLRFPKQNTARNIGVS